MKILCRAVLLVGVLCSAMTVGATTPNCNKARQDAFPCMLPGGVINNTWDYTTFFK
jgi:hypothetical protein